MNRCQLVAFAVWRRVSTFVGSAWIPRVLCVRFVSRCAWRCAPRLELGSTSVAVGRARAQLLLQSPPPRRLRVGALRCRVLVLCVAVGPAWNREFCVRSALRGALCARLVPLRFVRTVRSLRGCRVRAGRVRRGSFGSIACVWFSAFSGSAWNREFCVFVWFRVAPGGARTARVESYACRSRGALWIAWCLARPRRSSLTRLFSVSRRICMSILLCSWSANCGGGSYVCLGQFILLPSRD